jgi:GAF domain
MNIDRLLREAERRLTSLSEAQRAEVLDAVREEISKERRRIEPGSTVETERERRIEAEELREVLEAINRDAGLGETVEEVLKQVGRIIAVDSCALALLEGNGRFRIAAARGYPQPSGLVGSTVQDELTEEIRLSRWPVLLADSEADPRFRPRGGAPGGSWAGMPLLMEGDVIGILYLDRHRVEPFDDEDVHRAKAIAFSAAAAVRKARILEQVRRYAALMERVVAVDQAVFAGEPPSAVARLILDGALGVGKYRRPRRRDGAGRGRRALHKLRGAPDSGRAGRGGVAHPHRGPTGPGRRGRPGCLAARRAALRGPHGDAGVPRRHPRVPRPRRRVARRPPDGVVRFPDRRRLRPCLAPGLAGGRHRRPTRRCGTPVSSERGPR